MPNTTTQVSEDQEVEVTTTVTTKPVAPTVDMTKVEIDTTLRDALKNEAERKGMTLRRAVQEAAQMWIAASSSSEIDMALGLMTRSADGTPIPAPHLEDHENFCNICQAITSNVREHAVWETKTNGAGKSVREIKGFVVCPAFSG